LLQIIDGLEPSLITKHSIFWQVNCHIILINWSGNTSTYDPS